MPMSKRALVRMFVSDLRSAVDHDHHEDSECARIGLARSLAALGHYKLACRMLVTDNITPRSYCCNPEGG